MHQPGRAADHPPGHRQPPADLKQARHETSKVQVTPGDWEDGTKSGDSARHESQTLVEKNQADNSDRYVEDFFRCH